MIFEALQYEFMQNAVMAGLLASVACGIIGVYVVVNRMVFISGGIAHTAFGGVGFSFFLGLNPAVGALIFALASAIGIGLIRRNTVLSEDSGIGILWAAGMAIGMIFIGLTPGYVPDIASYLFGNILMVSGRDIWFMAFLCLAIAGSVILLYKGFFALSFDRDFADVKSLPVDFLYFFLLCLIALSVIVMMQTVGIVLVIALLTIPPGITRLFTYDMKKMMLFSVLLSIFFTLSGLWISYHWNVASGATIILVAGAGFLLSLLLNHLKKRYHAAAG